MNDFFLRCLKLYCRVALWFYFRQWKIFYHHPVPDGPVLFIANHPNAFLDALLIACSTHRKLWFLGRASVFEKAWARTILSRLRMSPLYRFRDGFGTLRKNEAIIDWCVDLLTQGESLLIFAEGNHNPRHTLLPLQKGFARMALTAEEKNHFQLNVCLVPVGIYYESHTGFRSRVLVQFGKPVSVNQVISDVTAGQRTHQLVKEATEGLKPLILTIPSDAYDERLSYLKANRKIVSDMMDQFQSDRQVVHEYTKTQTKTETNQKQTRPEISRWLNPVYLYYQINHLIPRLIIKRILKTMVRDPQFIGSLKFAIGMVLVPACYVLQANVCYHFTESWLISGLYFLSLPLSVLTQRK
jgi:1-acyl-sn-glycerol-3-phosphate acyltransferase